jgi:hypothetical protein
MSEKSSVSKAEIYGALAGLNRAFESVIESLQVLEREGVIPVEFLEEQSKKIEALRSEICTAILGKLQSLEAADLERLGKLRKSIESRIPFHRNGNENVN